MQAPISSTPPGSGVGIEASTIFRLPRRHLAPFRVSLHPLFELSDLNDATGFLAHVSRSGDPIDPDHGLAILRWTVEAVELLQPTATVAFTLSPEATLSPTWREVAAALPQDRLLLVFEAARVGQRWRLLDEANRSARRMGIRTAIRGQRVSSARGFDAIVLEPGSASEFMRDGEEIEVIATNLRTDRHLDWARGLHADFLEGSILAEPTEVVPVDVGRQRPPSTDDDRALSENAQLAAGDVDDG
jgi:hypothetical protein